RRVLFRSHRGELEVLEDALADHGGVERRLLDAVEVLPLDVDVERSADAGEHDRRADPPPQRGRAAQLLDELLGGEGVAGAGDVAAAVDGGGGHSAHLPDGVAGGGLRLGDGPVASADVAAHLVDGARDRAQVDHALVAAAPVDDDGAADGRGD